MKSQALRLLTSPPFAAVWRRWPGVFPAVLMFHRFEDRERGSQGFPPALLRSMLAWLRRHDYELYDLEEMIRLTAAGAPMPRRSVTITIDDGYLDQFEVAVPILAEFDAPATIFIATGFLDGSSWMWWDKIEHAFTQTRHRSAAFGVGNGPVRYDLATPALRAAASVDFAERCKVLSHRDSTAAIARLGAALEVEVPASPPPHYLPMSWDHVRIAERFGIRFGPSTVSHPVLRQVDHAAAVWEVEESWRRLQAEAAAPMPVFCYPNGKREDYGDRERRLVRDAGLLAAVTAEPGYWGPRLPESRRFDIPRFSGPESLPHLVKIASGVERLFTR